MTTPKKKAAKKNASNAGRKAGVSDFVYITPSLFAAVRDRLDGDHRDKDFKVSKKWLESLGYDLLEVSQDDLLSASKAEEIEKSRGHVSDSDLLYRFDSMPMPPPKIGRGEQSGSTHVFVPAAALLNFLDDKERYRRSYKAFNDDYIKDDDLEGENVFVTKADKLTFQGISQHKRAVAAKAETNAKAKGENVGKEVERALKEAKKEMIDDALKKVGRDDEGEAKADALALWEGKKWERRLCIDVYQELADYAIVVGGIMKDTDWKSDSWGAYSEKVQEVDEELESKDLLRYKGVPIAVAKDFMWIASQCPLWPLGKFKKLLSERISVEKIPVKKNWLEAITVLQDDVDQL